MSESFHFPEPAHFTAGTVGPPGARTFMLQADHDGDVVTFKLEKQQVAALAEYLAGILADLPAVPEPFPEAPDLIEPAEPVWTVGSIGIAVDEDSDRIVLVVHELVPEPEGLPISGSTDDLESAELETDEVAELLAELAGLSTDDLEDDLEDDTDTGDDDLFDEDSDAAIARLRLTRAQVAAFVVKAGELMTAGRPLCPFCGLPSDPGGHFCPREN
jgi:uncharacterized repeat protein (TIGR03847 family)